MKGNSLLNIVFILVVIGLAIFFFLDKENHLEKAKKEIIESKKKIGLAQDSVKKVLEAFQEIELELGKAYVDINLVEAERDMLELELKKLRTGNSKEIERLKKEIELQSLRRDSLRRIALEYEL